MQKNKEFEIGDILGAMEKIHKHQSSIPNITAKQSTMVREFVLNNVNKLTSQVIKKIKIKNL